MMMRKVNQRMGQRSIKTLTITGNHSSALHSLFDDDYDDYDDNYDDYDDNDDDHDHDDHEHKSLWFYISGYAAMRPANGMMAVHTELR